MIWEGQSDATEHVKTPADFLSLGNSSPTGSPSVRQTNCLQPLHLQSACLLPVSSLSVGSLHSASSHTCLPFRPEHLTRTRTHTVTYLGVHVCRDTLCKGMPSAWARRLGVTVPNMAGMLFGKPWCLVLFISWLNFSTTFPRVQSNLQNFVWSRV